MCYECWEEYGCPDVWNEKVELAVKLIEDVYDWSPVGGGLHVVVDDWNIDNYNVQWALKYMQTQEYINDAPKEQQVADMICGLQFKDMTMAERGSALARYDGFIKGGE